MKKYFFILTFLIFITQLEAQLFIKVVAPEKAVVIGEPFTIQYVVEQTEKGERFVPPSFSALASGDVVADGFVSVPDLPDLA